MTIDARDLTTPQTTEERLLEAGLQIWNAETAAVIFGGFSVARVAKAAGVTRATFYAYWPTADAYLERLLAYLGERPAADFQMQAVHEFEDVPQGAPDVVSQFLAVARTQVEHALTDPALRVRVGFASKVDEPGVAEALRELHRTGEDRLADRHRNIRLSWGREPRPPFTDAQIEAIFTMLLDGVAIRHLIDPETMPVDSFGQIGLMVLILATRVVGDPRSISDMTGIINQWPSAGMRLSAEPPRLERTRRSPPRRSTSLSTPPAAC